MYTKAFWRATFERVISTAAGAAISVATAEGFQLTSFDWQAAVSLIVVPSVVSLLKAIVAGAGGAGPGIGDAEVLNR